MKYYYLNSKDVSKGKYGEISTGLLEEKKSKFYSYVFNIENELDAIEKINAIKKDNKDARHVVYIYSYLDNNMPAIRFSDDGEPQGTGTKAIYELLDKEKITNILVVIVRYFGGILLGAGPLSRAYLNSSKDAMDKLEKQEIFNYIDYSFKCSYNEYNIITSKLNRYIDKNIVKIQNSEFKEDVEVTIKLIDDYYDEIVSIVKEVSYGNNWYS